MEKKNSNTKLFLVQVTKRLLVAGFLLIIFSSAYAKYLKLPDGSYVEISEKNAHKGVPFLWCRSYMYYPQAFFNMPPSVDICLPHYEKIKRDSIDNEARVPLFVLMANGEWYENKNGLLGKALYCDAYKNNQPAFLYDEEVTALCNTSLKNTDLGKAFSDAFVTIAIRALIAIVAFLGITYGILKTPKNTPISNGRFVGGIFVGLSLISFPSAGKSSQDFYFGITLVTCFWFIVGFAIGYLWRQFKNKKIKVANDSHWDDALKEFESANRVSSLWAKCFAEANGDEKKAKALYIKLRVKELSPLRH